MKVPKGFAADIEARCRRVPRESVANLLSALMPRDPVSSRAPKSALMAAMFGEGPQTKVPRRSSLRRSARHRAYEVLMRYHGARYGTKRQQQLDIIIEHTNTREAEEAGAEFAFITFAAKEGIIKFLD